MTPGPSDVPDPGGRPARVRKRVRVKVRVEPSSGQKVRLWWRRRWPTVVLVAWFVAATAAALALVALGYLRSPVPRPPE